MEMMSSVQTDPHTNHLVGQPVPVHIEATIYVDFDTRRLHIRQATTFNTSGLVHLDAQKQTHIVASSGNENLSFVYGAEDDILASRLAIVVPENRVVVFEYDTDPGALGLQWTTPEQADSAHPVLYSQFESIGGRSVFILPDAPSVRFTYNATLSVPKELRGLMAAGVYKGRTEEGTRALEHWEMHTPVPLYLVALNVGDFVYRAFDHRSGVWANPGLIDQAYDALSETPRILAAAERLFGPYLWGTYTTIVLPKRGFPFGAMEHPCMTSMNAMLIADQRAAMRVTIHELMHSWFGNLITNQTWNDFWLNEGVTTFGEWLLIEEVLGEDAMCMQIAAMREELNLAIENFNRRGLGGNTRLRTNLIGQSPDAAFSRVPYVKGALFLWTIMERVGRERMLGFLQRYIASYSYRSVATDEFLRFAAENLNWGTLEFMNAKAWVDTEGLPSNVPNIISEKAQLIVQLASSGEFPARDVLASWESIDWELYFAKLSRTAPTSVIEMLDKGFGFSTSLNGMLQYQFLKAALESHGVHPERFLPQIESFLMTYGRTLYILPLYEALIMRGELETARDLFAKAKTGYHPMGQERVEELLCRYETAQFEKV